MTGVLQPLARPFFLTRRAADEILRGVTLPEDARSARSDKTRRHEGRPDIN